MYRAETSVHFGNQPLYIGVGGGAATPPSALRNRRGRMFVSNVSAQLLMALQSRCSGVSRSPAKCGIWCPVAKARPYLLGKALPAELWALPRPGFSAPRSGPRQNLPQKRGYCVG